LCAKASQGNLCALLSTRESIRAIVIAGKIPGEIRRADNRRTCDGILDSRNE